jgi:ATP-binding cassette subfamily B protein
MAAARRFLAPEVVQTSAMDCGPASLKSFVEGHGIAVSYGRLREACQTDVDGTSIDTLEELAKLLGVDAQQILIPADHVFLAEAAALPGIAVVRLPNGNTHFAVVWKRMGGFCQVMDPASGRKWRRVAGVAADLYRHTMTVPADAWREWAGGDEFGRALLRRMGEAGIAADAAEHLLASARADPSWRALSDLDGAVRLAASLLASGGMRWAATAGVVAQFLRDPAAIPDEFRCAAAVPDHDDQVRFTGAVVVRSRGRRTTPAEEPMPPEIAAALAEKPAAPAAAMWRMLRDDGVFNIGLMAVLWLLQALTVVVEAVLFRGLFGMPAHLATRWERIGLLTGILWFAAALFVLSLPAATASLRYGRLLENRLRLAFFEKLPRLGDRYFRSRLTGDMAERGHAMSALRAVPSLVYQTCAAAFQISLVTAGMIWIDPAVAPFALAALATAFAIPLLAQPLLTEREMSVRAHVGAIARLNLDAMVGGAALRAHSAEEPFRAEQEALLFEWVRAALRFVRLSVTMEGLQLIAGTAFAAAILLRHLARGGDAGTSLLLVYWTLDLPLLAGTLTTAARQFPAYRNIALRLFEPLGALEAERPPGAAARTDEVRGGVAVAIEHVTVRAAGHTILHDVDLNIAPGEHVAVVGHSGAGKSSLVGLLLGWHTATSGSVRVDGAPLDAAALDRLRARTAWVDPAVHLWNQTLLENLRYGTPDEAASPLGLVIEQAELLAFLDSVPHGLQTRLGEGGGMLSGGEGQRVRFGRALARANAGLVILDEPFRGLDRPKRSLLLERARTIWHDATLLCITHDIAETLSFPRVIVVDHGRIAEDVAPAARPDGGALSALLRQEEHVRAAVWGAPEWRRLRVERGELIEHA